MPNIIAPQGGSIAPIDPAITLAPRTVIRWQGGIPVDVRTAWMGPGPQPDVNVVQDGLPTRTWDYPPYWNLRRTPNAGKAQESQGTDFGILRALAEQTHVRLVIETVKDQQVQKKWSYAVESNPGETLSEAKKRTLTDPRIAQVREFFKSPDRRHDWADWLRLLLEEVLVCDNLSLLHRSYEWGGASRHPYGVEVIDGDTIQVMSDLTGREPDPPSVAYEQWIRGVVFKQFSAPINRSMPGAAAVAGNGPASERIEELMYLPRNLRVKHFYGYPPVEQLLFYINIIMRRDLTKLAHYTDGNIPAGLLFVPEGYTPKQIADFQQWLDMLLSGSPSERSKLIAAPATRRGVQWAQDQILADRFDDDWIRLVCFCFNISNASFIQHANRSTSSNSKDQAEEDATSLTAFVGRVQNYIIRKWFGFADIVAVEEQQLERDAAKQKDIDVAQLSSGIVQVNEIRRRNGDEEYPELAGVNGQMTTTGFVPFAQSASAATEPGVAQQPEDAAEVTQSLPQSIAAKADHAYASTQVNLSGDVAAQVLALAVAIPDDALTPKGREDQPHVTVRFGIDPAVGLDEIRAAIGSRASGLMTFGVTAFFPGDEGDVVVLTVDSKDLRELNAAIAKGIETTDTQANYVPHVTLAYVEAGRGHEFAGNGSMVGVEFPYSSVFYADADGKLTRLQTIRGHVRMRAAEKSRRSKKNSSPLPGRTSSPSGLTY